MLLLMTLPCLLLWRRDVVTTSKLTVSRTSLLLNCTLFNYDLKPVEKDRRLYRGSILVFFWIADSFINTQVKLRLLRQTGMTLVANLALCVAWVPMCGVFTGASYCVTTYPSQLQPEVQFGICAKANYQLCIHVVDLVQRPVSLLLGLVSKSC